MKALLKVLFESTAHYAQSTARCESTAVMFEGTASFIREGKIIMARIWRFIEEVIMKKIEYCLFDVVVEFHSDHYIEPTEFEIQEMCMRTRSQSRNLNHQQQAPPAFVEPFNLEEPIENPAPLVVTMDDNRTMAQLLEAPTEGYEDAIVMPEITADNSELKHGLLNLVQNKRFFGHDKEDPHAHIRYFNKITSTMKFPNVPSTSVKLMLFPFSLEGAARIWLYKSFSNEWINGRW
ncbi:hypothetical protein Tco_1053696 [Tanacetum coccineum]|uniref:Reverse transcriptase domain-containing protein n=1 Tax=Tanacetum coccineum TaxID=301880 RepID=A0ABQ5GVK1_9ASTR